MKINYLCLLFLALFCPNFSVDTFSQSLSPSTTWHWDKGTIVVDTPVRPVGQEHVFQFAAPKLEQVRVGFVGLGMRGPGAVNRFSHIPGVQIVALCDFEAQRAESCQAFVRQKGLIPATIYSGEKGYEELCQREDIDLVYVATDWDHHFPVAKYALQHGKHVAIEVPSAMNLEQCWELINLSEQYRKHCMILENCCYDYYEMTALAMAQAGVLGEVIRAEGAYIHNLDEFWEAYWKNPDTDKEQLGWRMKYNMENRGDLYATHGLGPVAQCMNIHRGDRFTTLVAMDTRSFYGKDFVEKKTGKACSDFRNGDHTTTLMRTAQGKVVEIQHNVMTPQPYNRLFKLTGTQGYLTKYPEEKIALSHSQLSQTGVQPQVDNLTSHAFLPEAEFKALTSKYYHPILKKYGEMGREMGHGGMDFIMDSRLVYCLQNGLPLDMDVYDMAEWCALGELGALSMDNNCAAVQFPDFTRGHWNEQKGYQHAYATAEEEKATEDHARQYTAVQQEAVAKFNLWALYDAQFVQGSPRAQKKAYNKYVKSLQKAYRYIDTQFEK